MKKVLLLLMLVLGFSVSVDAQKLFSKEWRAWQMEKDSTSIVKKKMEAEEAAAAAKRKEKSHYYTNFVTPEEGLRISGELLKKSASCQYAAIGTMLSGATLSIAGAHQDKASKRNAYFIPGVGLAVVSFVFQIAAINYKFKSGCALQVAAGKIALNF